jgi:hypothetical protein
LPLLVLMDAVLFNSTLALVPPVSKSTRRTHVKRQVYHANLICKKPEPESGYCVITELARNGDSNGHTSLSGLVNKIRKGASPGAGRKFHKNDTHPI